MRRTPMLLAVLLSACTPGGASSPAAPTAAVALTGPGVAGTPSWTSWPQALHDAQHSASSTVDGPTTGQVRWSRKLEGDVTPGPVVGADGTVYAASNAGILHALDPATGADRWTFDGGGGYGSDRSTSPAVLPDATVLWPGPGHTLFALAADGTERWRLQLPAEVSSPVVSDDGATVVVGDFAGTVVALDVRGGGHRELWRTALEETSYGSPVLSPDATTVYQTTVGGLTALDLATGTKRWRWAEAEEIIEVSAAVGPHGTVVVGTNDPYAYGVGPDGVTRWRYERAAQTYSSTAVTRDGIAYFGDHAVRVTGLDVADGSVRYRFPGPRDRPFGRSRGIWTAPAVDAQHRVYVGTRQGFILGADAEGRLLFRVETGATVDSYPALTGDGALIVGDTSGTLWAIADS